MPLIIPSADLRNNYNKISKRCHETKEPIYVTRNGVNDLVVLSDEVFEKMRKQNAEDGALEYSAWKARIQKNYGKQKEDEDFCHYLIQKKRDIESKRKDEVGISLTLMVAAATCFFEANYAGVRNPARTGFVIFTMILSITVLVATTNYRLRVETEFLEDIMQVLGDKEQN